MTVTQMWHLLNKNREQVAIQSCWATWRLISFLSCMAARTTLQHIFSSRRTFWGHFVAFFPLKGQNITVVHLYIWEDVQQQGSVQKCIKKSSNFGALFKHDTAVAEALYSPVSVLSSDNRCSFCWIRFTWNYPNCESASIYFYQTALSFL